MTSIPFSANLGSGTTGIASSVGVTVYTDASLETVLTARVAGTTSELQIGGDGTGIYCGIVTASYGNAVVVDGGIGSGIYAVVDLVNPGGGFSGPYTVTFAFTDASGNPVEGVQFYVTGEGYANTGSGASVALALPAGTFTVSAYPTNGVMWTPATITITGSTSETIAGSAVAAPSAPANPTLCTPYVYIWPEVSGVSATLQLLNLPQNVQSLWLGPIVSIETSNSSGLITFVNFPIGSQVRLTIPDRGVARQYILSEGSQELS